MLDDILPDIPAVHPTGMDDPQRLEDVDRMKRRVNGFIAELSADKTGRKNAAKIEALVEEAQARYDKAEAKEIERHRERTRLNDLYEFKTGHRPPPFAKVFPLDPEFVDTFERFQNEELAKQKAIEDAEVEAEYRVRAEAKRVEEERFSFERAAQRQSAEEHKAERQMIRQHLRGGAPGRWGSIRDGSDPSISLRRL